MNSLVRRSLSCCSDTPARSKNRFKLSKLLLAASVEKRKHSVTVLENKSKNLDCLQRTMHEHKKYSEADEATVGSVGWDLKNLIGSGFSSH